MDDWDSLKEELMRSDFDPAQVLLLEKEEAGKISKDVNKNTITVADKTDEETVKYSVKEIFIKNLHFISGLEPVLPFKTSVRIRYRQEKQPCLLEKKSDGYRIIFDVPQSGVSVGQSVVLYDREICLGGGII